MASKLRRAFIQITAFVIVFFCFHSFICYCDSNKNKKTMFHFSAIWVSVQCSGYLAKTHLCTSIYFFFSSKRLLAITYSYSQPLFNPLLLEESTSMSHTRTKQQSSIISGLLEHRLKCMCVRERANPLAEGGGRRCKLFAYW